MFYSWRFLAVGAVVMAAVVMFLPDAAQARHHKACGIVCCDNLPCDGPSGQGAPSQGFYDLVNIIYPPASPITSISGGGDSMTSAVFFVWGTNILNQQPDSAWITDSNNPATNIPGSLVLTSNTTWGCSFTGVPKSMAMPVKAYVLHVHNTAGEAKLSMGVQ